ncbi:MAG: hypothetical protein QHH10_12070 [Peptococcaceae bacterium]|jgi:hypothetical protein|nr:hypothetical protein [Peptococcaceae bacterium]MDH7526040.1 hypothetical protein [Peptococcaceae bacterium]
MIQTCLNHITACLTQIGIDKHFIDDGNINDYKGDKYAGVMTEEGSTARDGRRIGTADDLVNMKRIYRRRLFVREQPFLILLVDKDKDKVDAHLRNFLSSLGTYIKDQDNNPIDITVSNANWMEERSKLSSRSGVEITVTFSGGIYKDQEVSLIDLSTALDFETEIGGTVDA